VIFAVDQRAHRIPQKRNTVEGVIAASHRS
jgi:hypothetical protein